jgi:tetratricopeptide (TPR) repeat protein
MKKLIALTVLALTLSTGFASAQSSVDNLVRVALQHAKNGEYQQAQGYLAEALKIEPNNQDIAIGLSIVSNQAGDHDMAIKVGLYTLKYINSSSAAAHREIGIAFAVKAAKARNANDYANAKECGDLATGYLVKSLQLNKTDKVAWDYLIAHADGMGDTELAAQARKTRASLNL